jgi:hypothetical protein
MMVVTDKKEDDDEGDLGIVDWDKVDDMILMLLMMIGIR